MPFMAKGPPTVDDAVSSSGYQPPSARSEGERARPLHKVAQMAHATSGTLTFATADFVSRDPETARTCRATLVFASPEAAPLLSAAELVLPMPDPRLGFVRAAQSLFADPPAEPAIH